MVLTVLSAGGVMINANRFYFHGVRTKHGLSMVPSRFQTDLPTLAPPTLLVFNFLIPAWSWMSCSGVWNLSLSRGALPLPNWGCSHFLLLNLSWLMAREYLFPGLVLHTGFLFVGLDLLQIAWKFSEVLRLWAYIYSLLCLTPGARGEVALRINRIQSLPLRSL